MPPLEKLRRCLLCRKSFPSASAANRICRVCKKSRKHPKSEGLEIFDLEDLPVRTVFSGNDEDEHVTVLDDLADDN